MKLACPSCHQPIEVTDLDSELSAQMSCPECGAVVGITMTVSILSAGAARTPAASSSSSTRRVVVAMNDGELRAAYAEALAREGFAVTETGESRQTLQMLGRAVPDVAVVDGGFPAIFGMGIGEIIKKSNVTRHTRVLGLRTDAASPLPVPGADRTVPVTVGVDTIVREVVGLAAARGTDSPVPPQKSLSEEITPAPPAPKRMEPAPAPEPPKAQQPPMPEPPSRRAVPTEAAPVAPEAPKPVAAAPPAPAPAAGAAPAAPAAARPAEAGDPEHAAAQRLARIIVSDTALYNDKAVQEAIRAGRLKETIEGLLDEGRQHYVERTPDHVRADTDYLGTALDQFVARKTGAMKPTAV
jgi:CheY-like chemotaxis protein